jgi:tRNA 2-thiocytidine biosynthesis protein TtcA
LADRELFDFEALDEQREIDFTGSCSTEDESQSKRINMVNLGFAAE